jgi:hypothetical protein
MPRPSLRTDGDGRPLKVRFETSLNRLKCAIADMSGRLAERAKSSRSCPLRLVLRTVGMRQKAVFARMRRLRELHSGRAGETARASGRRTPETENGARAKRGTSRRRSRQQCLRTKEKVAFAQITRLSVTAAISVVGSMVAMKTEPSADWRKRGWAHMPGFTPARTRYQLAGKLAMKPRTIPICIMNQ